MYTNDLYLEIYLHNYEWDVNELLVWSEQGWGVDDKLHGENYVVQFTKEPLEALTHHQQCMLIAVN